MPLQPPSLDELRAIAETHGLGLNTSDLEEFRDIIEGYLPGYDTVNDLTPDVVPVTGRSTAENPPSADENPLNAWYWRCHVEGAGEGLLAGKTVAIKDNVAVAGVPMMNGSALLEGYVPEFDATVVSWILDAGGTIVGKAACEDLCLSGGSHTCRTGPLRNPWDVARAAGGSSGGSAALVATREVDVALGGDQGGSVRIPSSWCGVVGHKPTRGLVPYTGAFPIEMTLDHLGPMGRTVADVAAFLEVIAGVDGLDHRQPTTVEAVPYAALVEEGSAPQTLRVAVLDEGFGWPGLSEAAVDDAVRVAVEQLRQAGATVDRVSIPLHRNGLALWAAVATEGAAQLMVKGNGFGTNHTGFYAPSLMEHFGQQRARRASEFPDTVKLAILLGDYLQERYHGVLYARARNLVPALTAAYDAVLADYDVLVMPTLPMRATPLPASPVSRADVMARAQEMLCNTAPIDLTGHPAITVPCALVEGLPVGLMMVGRHFDDLGVLQAARCYERSVGEFETLIGRPPVSR